MIWPSRDKVRLTLKKALAEHSASVQRLPGISDPRHLDAFALHLVASLRREDYYRAVQRQAIPAKFADPNDASFDAERAVAYHVQRRDIDEATWLVFLMTHCARPVDSGWLRLRDLYGRLGTGIWDWSTVSAQPTAFKIWLSANWKSVRGKFGNHRKYESLRPNAKRNMGIVVEDYVNWVGGSGHRQHFTNILRGAGNDLFDILYREMNIVSFGRLAKFDYLMLLSRYGILPISPVSAYLDEATGPRLGATLLFTGAREQKITAATLQEMLDKLDADLGVGMSVLEDSLCNWQKKPDKFVHFRG